MTDMLSLPETNNTLSNTEIEVLTTDCLPCPSQYVQRRWCQQKATQGWLVSRAIQLLLSKAIS